MRLLLSQIILCVFVVQSVFAQSIDAGITETQGKTFQKLYIQTDREIYFLGDTIWLSGYLLDGKTHIPAADDQNLYFDLIDSTGAILTSGVFPVFKGFSEGNIPLDDTLWVGNVVLRAYTSYLRNFGDNSFFYKSLTVERTKNSFEIENDTISENSETNVEPMVRFFPEGGILLESSPNVIGIIVSDKKGRRLNTNGAILDENNKTIAEFETSYKGMGKFNFYPNPGKKYKAVLNAFPQLEFPFYKPEESGIKIQFYDHDFLDVAIFSNSKILIHKKYTLACMNRGEVLFYKQVRPTKKDFSIRIDRDKLGQGINRFVLLNDDMNPVSERLYFNDCIMTNTIQVELPEADFQNRSLVELKLIADKTFLTDSSRVSVAVVNENSLNAEGESQNILSRLYLDSELLGRMEAPLDFFRDGPEITSAQKLDLLMLTQGWSSYVWNKVAELSDQQFNYPLTAGFDIHGYVTNLWNKKRVVGSEVLLTVQNDSLFTCWETSDENGQFSFEHIYLSDSAGVTLQARKGNESESTRVFIEPLEMEKPEFALTKYKRMFDRNIIPLELYRQNYYARLAEKEFEPEKDVILIEEVEVNANAPEREEEVKFSQIYSKADFVIKTTEADFMYSDLKTFLFAKAPSFFGNRMPLSINAGGGAVIYVDGMPWNDPIFPFPPLSVASVDRVDIISTHNPTGMALLGVRGSGGGIFIYTKQGVPDEVREKYLKGILKQKLQGFSKYRKFYSPVFTSENLASEKPDFRTTLYWNPSVKIENGEANISFFSSDDIARFSVIVEGITKTGTVCLGKTSFNVIPEIKE